MKKLALALALITAFAIPSTGIVAQAKTKTTENNTSLLSNSQTWYSHVTKEDACLRKGGGLDYGIKRLLQPGDPITVYSTNPVIVADGYRWYYVSYKGIYGYITEDNIYG
ncbi:hypothetical protein CLPUN_14480 [Clostridium puniceum]|uniref:Bacterial SH3 domain protein n=1 Tax=Clostridium puniceum TaxID=29367 RepID=A0A1S8TPU1_9CLOT|nr:hypothetical protein [Clostridium puniceum]OOM79768.1 hypothetical protein CLPUN_14480 [Clostridium puniceum]